MKRGSKLTTIVSTMLVVLMILLIVYTGSRYDELKEELAIRQMHFLNQRPAEISQYFIQRTFHGTYTESNQS